MEELKNQTSSSPKAKTEGLTNHANAIREMNIADEREIIKWMDALCMDETICREVFGHKVYEEVKGEIYASKEFLDINDDEKIKALPEFITFAKEQHTEILQKSNIDNLIDKEKLKEQAKEIQLPEALQREKEELTSIEKSIRRAISESEEKHRGKGMWFSYILKQSKYIEADEKKEIEKKVMDFIKGDYLLESIREKIKQKRGKLNPKIKKAREKEAERLRKISKKEKKQAKIEIDGKKQEKELIDKFRATIKENKTIKERFYLPEDKKDIERVQAYFKQHRAKTISSPDLKKITKTGIGGTKDMMEKTENGIKIPNDDYNEMERRELDYGKKFKDKIWNPKEYLFDRLIEYVGMDILEYEIQQNIRKKGKNIERFTTYKTDPLDDSSAGADYVVLYKFKGEKRERIAPIDLFVSDKILKVEREEKEGEQKKIQPGSLEEKLEKAKEPKAPYSTYIKLFGESSQKIYTIMKFKRYVEQQHPALTYSLLKEIIQNTKLDTKEFLDGFEKKGKLYRMIEKQQEKDRAAKEKVEKEFLKDIINELEKVAACRIETKSAQ